MNKTIIEITEESATIKDENPQEIGSKLNFSVNFPEGSVIDCLVLTGEVTKCIKIGQNGDSYYELETKIVDLSTKNKQILGAYLDYSDTLEAIEKSKSSIDYDAINNAMREYEEEFGKVLSSVELLLSKTKKNVTVH